MHISECIFQNAGLVLKWTSNRFESRKDELIKRVQILSNTDRIERYIIKKK